jgi:hypothetical protein
VTTTIIESDPTQKKSSDDKKPTSGTGNVTNSFITVTLNGSPSDSQLKVNNHPNIHITDQKEHYEETKQNLFNLIER